jgi:hypothetical protein
VISAEFEFRGIWNVAAGSVSSRLCESLVPQEGIVGMQGATWRFLLEGLASFRVAVDPLLPSRQFIPKLSNNEDSAFSSFSGRSYRSVSIC